jgi:hypothetical protein
VAFRWELAPDPAGGSLVVTRMTSLGGNHWSRVDAHRFAASGDHADAAVEVVPSPSEPLFFGGGVSTSGDALVLAQHSAQLDVAWIARGASGPIAAATAERVEDSAAVVGAGLTHALDLLPLLDGGVAVRSDGTWRRRYDHLATVSGALPDWLAQRPDWSFRFTRGNRGHAAFPPPGRASADCTQSIDLVSPSGLLCGRVTLREEGSGCTTGVVDQGWDGTVVQQSGNDPCTYRWWPRLLAGD